MKQRLKEQSLIKQHNGTKAMALAIAGVLSAGMAQAEVEQTHRASATSLEHVLIIGSEAKARMLSGSALMIDSAELEKFQYTDIHRVLRQVPGVYIQQEDGYGLRPNIGIRGAGGHRSEKITLLEDGVLIAPAPYAGPSAYYFPTTGRMTAIEVLKGPESLKQGPYTVGGAVNMASTPIPASAAGEVLVEVGEYGENRLHAWYGSSDDTSGWLLETHQHNADGFNSIDRSNTDSGLKKEDYMAKLRINTAAGVRYYNQLDLKLQYSTERSNQSYLGLTDADFDRDPNRRYGLSGLDQMNNEHAALTLSHLITLTDTLSVQTSVYYNDFERDWYKLGGGAAYIDAANNGSSAAQNILHGVADVSNLKIKHNARQYKSYGVQSALNWQVDLAGLEHDLDLGFRLHEDEVDRFQPADYFDQVNGSLVYQSTSLPGSSDNRVEEAEALSLFVMDHIAVTDRLDLTAALRYEDYNSKQARYSDVARSTYTEKTASNEELLLGLGATYQLTDQWSLLAGVHQGFAPAGVASSDDPEKSTNYELGGRFSQDRLFVETIAFYSDYENSVKYCTVANPCSGGQTSGSVSRGQAEIQGLEFLVNYDISNNASYSLPVAVSYTYTDAQYTQNSQDAGFDYLDGDVFEDIPEHQWSGSIGYIANAGWDAYLNASYSDKTCIDNSCDRAGEDIRFKQTEDLLVFDFSASYPLAPSVRVYGKIDNLLDEQVIVSRKPDGARANKPRTAYMGLKVSF